MSEYIMGLGITVRICKLYDDLVSMVLADSEFSSEFNNKVLELELLLDDENMAYDRLDEKNANIYFGRISNDDLLDLDNVKNRYYFKLKERLSILDGSNNSDYPFSIETAIVGKILLDSIKKIENDIINNLDNKDVNSIYNLLYSFHRTYKYTLISMNAFLERLAIDFNFDISKIPSISFDRIKINYDCNSNFNKYLDNILLIIAKDIIKVLYSNDTSIDVTSIYSNLLSISQLEIITSYLSINVLNKLSEYADSYDMNSSFNGKYVKKLVFDKINGGNNGKHVK